MKECSENTAARKFALGAAALAAALLLVGAGAAAAQSSAPRRPIAPAASVAATPQPATRASSTTPFGWVLQLRGSLDRDLTSGQFAALAARYQTSWNDGAHTWAGVPLWRLVALVDDKTPGAFNSDLAKEGYSVQVIGLDGAVVLKSDDGLWVHNDKVLIADEVDGAPLPFGTLAAGLWTPQWPAQVVGPSLSADQEVGGVARVVVYKRGATVPTSPAIQPGWILQVRGGLSDVDETAARFRALAKAHPVSWTEAGSSITLSGTALWRLVALADGGSPAALNADLLGLGYLDQPGVGYSVDVVGMGASAPAVTTFTASQFAGTAGSGSSGVALADRQGVTAADLGQLTPLAGSVSLQGSTYTWSPAWPLRLGGPDVASGALGGVLRLVIHQPAAPAYVRPLVLSGRRTASIPYLAFPTPVTWDGRKAGNINPQLRALYRGQTLSRLIGLVDDRDPRTFNVALARKGYTIKFIASDGYTWTISSKTIVGQTHWIVASLKDGVTMSSGEGPYRFVGSFIKPFYGKQSVFKLTKIRLVF